jgi:hypothetical protein
MAVWGYAPEVYGIFTTHFTCFTGIKVQILTPEELLALAAPQVLVFVLLYQ